MGQVPSSRKERKIRYLHDTPDNQSTKLSQKIPVYIVYATAYERDGQLYFGNDLYSRDDALVQAVEGSIVPTSDALRNLDALRKLVKG